MNIILTERIQSKGKHNHINLQPHKVYQKDTAKHCETGKFSSVSHSVNQLVIS
jgi:hypothetical protein